LNSTRELVSTDAAEKTLATGGTARKELTLLGGTFEQARLTCIEKK
jgi:hypothetical protein